MYFNICFFFAWVRGVSSTFHTLLTVKILYNMDDHMNEIIERSVRKRPLEFSNVSNEFAVKKPALVNPLQETNKLIPQSIKSLEIYE